MCLPIFVTSQILVGMSLFLQLKTEINGHLYTLYGYIYILVYVLVLTPLVQPPGCYSKECLLLLTVVYPTANLNLPMEPSISGKIGKVTTWTSCLPFASQKNSNCWFINIQPFKSMDVHPKWPMLYNREKWWLNGFRGIINFPRQNHVIML